MAKTVNIKDLEVDMPVKNNGVEFEVKGNNGRQMGDCYVTKTGVTWCPGKTTKANGIRITWDNLQAICQSDQTLDAAIKAAAAASAPKKQAASKARSKKPRSAKK